MKNILSLSLSLTLVACASGLPELKYADGSVRIPVNPKPIPLPSASQPAAVADAAKPAAKHGCHRPPDKTQAIGFERVDKVQYADPQNQLIFYH